MTNHQNPTLVARLWKRINGWFAKPQPQEADTQTVKSTKRDSKKAEEPPKYREIKWHGLILRSNSELKIAKELDLQGLLFIAGPKIRLNTENHRQTREADFLIHHNGQWGILEVDGPHHQHSVEADAWRDKRFESHGIRVIRFSADRCFTEPRVVVVEFLAALATPPQSPDSQNSLPAV